MTIGASTTRVSLNCDGASKVFPVDLQAYLDTDFTVYLTNPVTGQATPLILNSDYSLAPSGTLAPTKWVLTTLPVGAYAAPFVIQVILEPDQVQQTQYVQGQAFPSLAVQTNVDRLTQMILRLQDQLNRSVLAPDSDVNPVLGLPNALTRANTYPTFDAAGNLSVAATLPAAVLSQATIGQFLWPRTAAELAAGVTPVAYFYQPGDVRRYGPALDGVTDDTAALQNWLSVGGDLIYPVPATAKVTATLTLVSNTRIRGVPGAVIRQYTANQAVISATGQSNIHIQCLKAYAVGSFTSITNGNGFAFFNCSDCTVERVAVENHRGTGVLIYNSTRCRVLYCIFTNSPVVNTDTHDQAACDIAFQSNSSYNMAVGNFCISGQGTGIAIQSITAGDNCSYNIVHGNTITDCKIYGILAGYQLNAADTLRGNVVTGNIVKNTTGAVAHNVSGYIFGASIYTVGSQDAVISNNLIEGSHTAAVVFVDQLAPGAIGMTLCGQMVVTGNKIRDAHMYGITVRDPGGPYFAINDTIVSNNDLYNVTLDGIQVLQKANISVMNNLVNTVGGSGVTVSNTVTKRRGVKVCGNDLRNCVTGCQIVYCDGPVASMNTIDTAANHGLYFANCDNPVANGNYIRYHGIYGVYVDATCTKPTGAGNQILGNGASLFGYACYARGPLGATFSPETNGVSGCATPWVGDYNPFYAAAPTTGTWVQGDEVWEANPASAGYRKRICTVGGTPGTWKQWGLIT